MFLSLCLETGALPLQERQTFSDPQTFVDGVVAANPPHPQNRKDLSFGLIKYGKPIEGRNEKQVRSYDSLWYGMIFATYSI